MTVTQGYTPKITPLFFEQDGKSLQGWQDSCQLLGGWDPEHKKMVPMTLCSSEDDSYALIGHALDSIAAGVEAGAFDESSFPNAAFSTVADFERFRDGLVGYGETFWMNDRYFGAFQTLNFHEESARSFGALADALDAIARK
jgi:hypothetical protein